MEEGGGDRGSGRVVGGTAGGEVTMAGAVKAAAAAATAEVAVRAHLVLVGGLLWP